MNTRPAGATRELLLARTGERGTMLESGTDDLEKSVYRLPNSEAPMDKPKIERLTHWLSGLSDWSERMAAGDWDRDSP